jgi:hypothetical protein
MTTDPTKWSTDEISYVASFAAITFLILGILNLGVCLFAPLFGGRFIVTGVLLYGSWVGFALGMLRDARRMKARQTDIKVFAILTALELFCCVLWCFLQLPFPYNAAVAVLGGALFLFLKLSWHKRFKEQVYAQNTK